MQKSESQEKNKKSLPIGGWLWLIMIILILNGLASLFSISSTITGVLQDEWESYLTTLDNLLKLRLNIYIYFLITAIGDVLLIIWALKHFFKRTIKFPVIFMSFIGYSILSQVIGVYLLDYYSKLANIDATSLMDNNLVKVAVFGALAGLYLNKGERPIKTFRK